MEPDPHWQPIDTDRTHGFWESVSVAGPDVCWPYVGRGSLTGGGHMRITWNGERTYAHRVGFLLAGGVLDDANPWVLHERCSWGLCCNPWCLVAGDARLNAQHRDQQQRRTPFLPRGADAAVAKLTAREVEALRLGKAQGVRAETLAAMFNVSRSTVFNVVSGKYYASDGWVTGPS